MYVAINTQTAITVYLCQMVLSIWLQFNFQAYTASRCVLLPPIGYLYFNHWSDNESNDIRCLHNVIMCCLRQVNLKNSEECFPFKSLNLKARRFGHRHKILLHKDIQHRLALLFHEVPGEMLLGDARRVSMAECQIYRGRRHGRAIREMEMTTSGSRQERQRP